MTPEVIFAASTCLRLLLEHLPPNTILLWRFSDADPRLQALSDSGGDEDWLAFAPSATAQGFDWVAASSSFSSCGDPQRIELPGLGTVFIGAHA